MSLRARHADISARKLMIIAVSGGLTAVLLANVAILADRLPKHTDDVALERSLGMVVGGPDRAAGDAVVEEFSAFLRRPPAPCPRPAGSPVTDFWLGRASFSVFIDSPQVPDLPNIEHTLDGSPYVAYWIYQPARQAVAEGRRTFSCLPVRSLPASVRVQLNSTVEATRQALMARMRLLVRDPALVTCGSVSLTCPPEGLLAP